MKLKPKTNSGLNATTELSSHLGAGQIVSSQYIPVEGEKCECEFFSGFNFTTAQVVYNCDDQP